MPGSVISFYQTLGVNSKGFPGPPNRGILYPSPTFDPCLAIPTDERCTPDRRAGPARPALRDRGGGTRPASPPYLFAQINRLMHEKRRAGSDVIDLGMGNPSDPPQDLVVEKLAEAARDPKNHGYSEAMGILSLRREVAAKYFKTHGVRLDPQREVVVCLGSKEGFGHLCLALVGPGDTAIVPAPSYPAHLYAVSMAAANAILLEVTQTEKLLANVDYTCRHMVPRPKVCILNFPHNPSTTVVEPEFYVEMVKLAKRYGFMVISDLAYADIAFDGYKAPSFLAAAGAWTWAWN